MRFTFMLGKSITVSLITNQIKSNTTRFNSVGKSLSKVWLVLLDLNHELVDVNELTGGGDL